MDARLEIDRIACDGHGACAEVLPERIALDDWGYPILLPGPLPASMVELARLAIETCPVRAIRLRGLARSAVAPPASAPARVARSARSARSAVSDEPSWGR